MNDALPVGNHEEPAVNTAVYDTHGLRVREPLGLTNVSPILAQPGAVEIGELLGQGVLPLRQHDARCPPVVPLRYDPQ